MVIYLIVILVPSAADLRKIIVENGGEFHHYYKKNRTTYMIAMNLAKSKLDGLKTNEIVLHPQWITNSLQQGALLPIQSYLLSKQVELSRPALPSHDKPETSASRFYGRSRLHLIATLSQEMKEYVAGMRANMDAHDFISRSKLRHLESNSW